MSVRFLVATLVVAGASVGCGYEHGSLDNPETDAGVSTSPGTDADPGSGSGSGSGAPTISRSCRFPDADLRLCLEFENRPIVPKVYDGSLFLLDAISNNISEIARAGGYAAGIDHGSDLSVQEHAMLDLQHFTMEMFVYSATPYQYGPLIRNAGQYQISFSDGSISCSINNQQSVTSPVSKMQDFQWAHVACTYDKQRIRVYVNGTLTACGANNATVSESGTSGVKLVENFIGSIDEVRAYARALPSSDICTHAGKASCTTTVTCP